MNEIWKPVTYEEYSGNYEVSNMGRIRNSKDKGIRIPGINRQNGYLYTVLSVNGKKKTISIHRTVALAFIPNPLNLETVNHKDEIKFNNWASNLEWLSQKDNNWYGTHMKRMLAHRAQPVMSIDNLGNSLKFKTLSECSKELNIPRTSISACLHGRQKTAKGYIFKAIPKILVDEAVKLVSEEQV